MSLSNFDAVWKLISDHEFVVHSNDDLSCVICRKLMTDACTSLCGCQYCYSCIRDFIATGNKYCPGWSSECKEDYLEFDRNVYRNLIINKKISKTEVKCPNQSCECHVELIELESHLRVCTKQPMKCPYVAIGCTNDLASKETILAHLQIDFLRHVQLSIASIKNLEFEAREMKDDLVSLKSEITSLKEEIRNKDNKIMTLEANLTRAMRGMEIKVNEEMNMREDYQRNKDSVIAMMNSVRQNMEDCSKRNQSKIVNLKQQLNNVMNDMKMNSNDVLKERERVLNEEKLKVQGMIENVNTMMQASKIDIDRMRSERDEWESRFNRWMKWNRLCPNIEADYVWKIDGVSTKKGKSNIYSEAFHHDNYKLSLYLWIDSGSDETYLYCDIMKGDNDDNVEWPMRRLVTLSVIDQYTRRTHKSEIYQSDFTRPTNDRGCSVGGVLLLCCDNSIIVDDSLIVSCYLSICN